MHLIIDRSNAGNAIVEALVQLGAFLDSTWTSMSGGRRALASGLGREPAAREG